MTRAEQLRGMHFRPGTRVRYAWPDFKSPRKGQVGTVRETVEFRAEANPDRRQAADYVVLHVVDFQTDILAANGVNLGRVPAFALGYELEAVPV